jgi:hypothetical protein
VQDRISRRSSGWGEVNEEEDDTDVNDEGSIGKKRDDDSNGRTIYGRQ